MIPEPGICRARAANARHLFALLHRVNHLDREIRPIETADECLRLIETELLNDVGANVRRRSGCESESLNFVRAI